MTVQPKTIYLAGPEVFLHDAVEVGRRKKELCAERGFRGLFPFDNEVVSADGARIDRVIYRANAAMIREADFGIFNLTPFRGPSADVGTVFELGMMTGLGKPCFGYSNEASSLLDRMRADAAATLGSDGIWTDRHGMSIEDFGNADNLMIDGALDEGGVPLHRVGLPAADDLFRELAGFAACLDALAVRLASAP